MGTETPFAGGLARRDPKLTGLQQAHNLHRALLEHIVPPTDLGAPEKHYAIRPCGQFWPTYWTQHTPWIEVADNNEDRILACLRRVASRRSHLGSGWSGASITPRGKAGSHADTIEFRFQSKELGHHTERGSLTFVLEPPEMQNVLGPPGEIELDTRVVTSVEEEVPERRTPGDAFFIAGAVVSRFEELDIGLLLLDACPEVREGRSKRSTNVGEGVSTKSGEWPPKPPAVSLEDEDAVRGHLGRLDDVTTFFLEDLSVSALRRELERAAVELSLLPRAGVFSDKEVTGVRDKLCQQVSSIVHHAVERTLDPENQEPSWEDARRVVLASAQLYDIAESYIPNWWGWVPARPKPGECAELRQLGHEGALEQLADALDHLGSRDPWHFEMAVLRFVDFHHLSSIFRSWTVELSRGGREVIHDALRLAMHMHSASRASESIATTSPEVLGLALLNHLIDEVYRASDPVRFSSSYDKAYHLVKAIYEKDPAEALEALPRIPVLE